MKKSVFLLFALLSYLLSHSQENRFYEILDERTEGNEILHAEAAPLNQIIYDAATIGRKGITVPAYADTLFTKKMTEEEIRMKGALEETITYAPDPEDPDNLVDTTFLAEFIGSDIVNYLLMEEYEIEGTDTTIKIVAIAPLCFNATGKALYNFEIMFWVKMEDLDKVIMQEPYFSYENRQGQRRFYHYLHERMFVATPNDYTITW
jgi:hypothetical protein